MIILGCEGNEEVYLIEYLLNKNYLIFERKDILDRRPIHFRQPREISPLIDLLPIDTELVFYRIGDKQNDEYDFRYFRLRETLIKTVRVCTLPELEILIIINEGLYEGFLKNKSKMMPKQFVKEYVKGYTNIKDYLSKHDLKEAILKYKSLKKHEKDQIYLADLIKDI